MSNLDLSQFSPLGLDSLDSIGAIEPITPQKRPSGQSLAPKLTGNITEFVKSAGPAAARVAKNLGVPVEAVLGQWGLETGWGKSVIPGTNNLGNIKDFSGKGVAATDNMTGSRDRYRQYGSVDEFADDFSRLLKNKRYSAALGSQDAETYFSILKQGGYAEDPSYVQKGKHAASLVSEAIKKAGFLSSVFLRFDSLVDWVTSVWQPNMKLTSIYHTALSYQQFMILGRLNIISAQKHVRRR